MTRKFIGDENLSSNTYQQKLKIYLLLNVIWHDSIHTNIKEILRRKMVSDIMGHPLCGINEFFLLLYPTGLLYKIIHTA